MTLVLAVELDAGPIERIRADLVVVGIASGDRPLRRGAGRADWRLCGSLWNLVASEKLSGALGEVALLSARGALRAPLLLAVGLGPREAMSTEAWRELGRQTGVRALGLRAGRAVLDLASDAAATGPEASCALFSGVADAVAERRVGLCLVLTGDGASESLAELRTSPPPNWPPGVELRYAAGPPRTARGIPTQPGGFGHTGIPPVK